MDGKFFVDTYTAKVNNQYYLLVCNSAIIKFSPVLYLHSDRQTNLVNVEVDTVPFYALKVKRRWIDRIRSLSNEQSNVLFSLVYQYLNDSGIKKFYYDVWIENHNFQARKQNKRDIIKINTLKKKGLLKKRDVYIKHITSNMGIREAAKMSLV